MEILNIWLVIKNWTNWLWGRLCNLGTQSSGLSPSKAHDDLTKAPPSIPIIIGEIQEELKKLGKSHKVSVCKRNGQEWWKVSPADFTDAYFFLTHLSCLADITSKMRMRADILTFSFKLNDGGSIMLTDKSRYSETMGTLMVFDEERTLMTIRFNEERKDK